MAQLVEHNLAKVGVAGSSPVVRSSNVQVPFPDGTCFDKRRDGQVVRQGPAKPSPPVRIRFSPPYADMAQLVEHNLAKVGVAGSSPVVRSRLVRQGPAKPSPPVRIRFSPPYADMAQLVEHNLAKVGVAGSSPVVRSRLVSPSIEGLFYIVSRLVTEPKERVISNLLLFLWP